VELNRRFRYIGPDRRFVIQPRCYKAGPLKEGLALVCTKGPSTPLKTGEYGSRCLLILRTLTALYENIRYPFSGEYASNFSEGLATVKPGTMLGGCAKGGYLSTTGEWSIKPQFDEVRDLSEGLAAVNQAEGPVPGESGAILTGTAASGSRSTSPVTAQTDGRELKGWPVEASGRQGEYDSYWGG